MYCYVTNMTKVCLKTTQHAITTIFPFFLFCFINWFIYISLKPYELVGEREFLFCMKNTRTKKKKKYTNFATTHQVVSYNKSYIMFCSTKLLALFIFYYWNLFHHTHVKVGQTTMHVYFWSYDPYNKSCDLAYSNKFMSIIFF